MSIFSTFRSFSRKMRLPKLRTSKPRHHGKHWERKPDVVIFPDGREVCNPVTPGGRAEYFWRTFLMWLRQEALCCNCGLHLSLSDMTFEHENGRTKARQDDRIAIFDEDGRFVRHLNGASHSWCNSLRGSKRTEIFHGSNCVVEREAA